MHLGLSGYWLTSPWLCVLHHYPVVTSVVSLSPAPIARAGGQVAGRPASQPASGSALPQQQSGALPCLLTVTVCFMIKHHFSDWIFQEPSGY